jgi:hypothetical protein
MISKPKGESKSLVLLKSFSQHGLDDFALLELHQNLYWNVKK